MTWGRRTSPAGPAPLLAQQPKEFVVCTTRLSDELLASAQDTGAHPEPEHTEPETKVVKRTSKGVKTK